MSSAPHKVPSMTELVGQLSGHYTELTTRLNRETTIPRQLLWHGQLSTTAATLADITGVGTWQALTQQHDREIHNLQSQLSSNLRYLRELDSGESVPLPQSARDTPQLTGPLHLRNLAQTWGMRHDWHEPDEQGVSAIVRGKKLDNAGFPAHPGSLAHHDELTVYLLKDGVPQGWILLADLLALAARDDAVARPILEELGLTSANQG